MTQNYNSSLTNEIRDVCKIQAMRDIIPNQLADKIIPVIDVNPKHARLLNFNGGIVSIATGNATVFTAGTDRDTFLTSLSLGFSKNGACDVPTGRCYLQITQNGAAVIIQSLPELTLTEESANQVISFPYPIKLDRGSTLVLSGKSFTAGAMCVTCNYSGFTIENINS